MKDIKDYLHLYLGCECFDEYDEDVKILHSVISNGEVLLKKNTTRGRDYREVKIILRRLDSITQQEWIEVLAITQWNQSEYDKEWFWSEWEDGNLMIYNKTCVELTRYLLSKSFDIFGLIDEGLAIDRATLTVKSES